jgi:hypothetical protein
MFARKTTFVIGAGASFEFGLPVGETLKDRIVSSLPGKLPEITPRLHTALLIATQGDQNELARACRRIKDGLPLATSIDRFMDFHQADEMLLKVGKVAITSNILTAERKSTLHFDSGSSMNFSGIKDTWLPQLFRYMQEGAKPGNVKDILKNISFITFNYDRCIEHFLYNALIAFSGCNGEEAAEAMREITILHPYGRLGRLPWDIVNPNETALAYGFTEDNPRNIFNVSTQLKTFAEQIAEDDTTLCAVRREIETSKQLIFMGFSFLEQNMKYLTPENPTPLQRSPIATSYNESTQNTNISSDAITTLLSGRNAATRSHQNAIMLNVTAVDLIKAYGNQFRS